MTSTKEELNYLLDSLITGFLSNVTQDQIREFKTKYPKFGWEENKNRVMLKYCTIVQEIKKR